MYLESGQPQAAHTAWGILGMLDKKLADRSGPRSSRPGDVATLQAVADAWPAVMLAAVVLFGLAIGSFLNVVIARVPAGRSLWRPRSACPGCSAPLAWHDNIPVLSFLWLRGRCRACGIRISRRYPIVELVTAVALAWRTSPSVRRRFRRRGGVLAALIAITAIDLQHQLIPDVITLPGILVGLVANLATGRVSWLDSVIGIALGGGLFLAIIFVSGGGMGGGDLKLGAMLGAFLGWKVLVLPCSSPSSGGVWRSCCWSPVARQEDPIPLAPFLPPAGPWRSSGATESSPGTWAGSAYEPRGFALVELMVAVAVIGVLAVLVAPTLVSYARTSALQAGARELATAINLGRQLAISRTPRCASRSPARTFGSRPAAVTGCLDRAGDRRLRPDQDLESAHAPGQTTANVVFTISAPPARPEPTP